MLRWAILGTGFISNTVAAAIKANDGSTIEIVAGRNQERVDAFQAEHGIARATTDFDQAIADPNVDAVYIGLPNHAHHQLAIEAAKHGKAILSEKSLTTTMDSADALVAGVRDRAFFVEGLMYLAHPVHQRFISLLGEDRIGEVQAVSARYSASIAEVVNPLGRGTIFNLGCYPASLLHLVVQTCFGPSAFSGFQLSGSGTLTPDGTIGHAVASIRFDNGTLATLASTDNFGMAHEFVVQTTKGELSFETNPWLPVAGDNIITWTPYGGEPQSITVTDRHDAFHHQIALVEASVLEGRLEAQRPSPRLDDSLEIMSLLTDWEAKCLDPIAQ